MDVSLIRKIGHALFVAPAGGFAPAGGGATAGDRLNLRRWFVFFVCWLAALALLARTGLVAYEGGSRAGMALWLAALYVFYMSLCCTFFPAPTTWIVMMVASGYVAGELGVQGHMVARMLVVACLGALGTAMANLNEYHIFTFLLRYGRLAHIRKTRIYAVASRWFGIRPFWTIVLFSFIPIPVDVIRWLAITYRYPRLPYFVAYYMGRWVRYAGLAAVTIWGNLQWYHILIVQCAVALLALIKIVQQVVRRHRAPEPHADPQAADVGTSSESDIMQVQTLPPSGVSN
jgi:membrane protein YqaA with SNARE-associated domain